MAAIDATEDVEVDEGAMSDDNVNNDADDDTGSSDMDSDEERKRSILGFGFRFPLLISLCIASLC